MKINLLIVQPAGYIHSLCFLDTARYLRYHLKQHDVETIISKNRPMREMINIIFGAHLGIPHDWKDEFRLVIFNQEQIGLGGADLPADYLKLLRESNTIDYDMANISAYSEGTSIGGAGPIRALLPLRHAPYLEPMGAGQPISERPIDLLFFGSLNQSRINLIERIRKSGVEVSRFDYPMYGPERDAYIGQAKAVLNIPFYGTNRFEQVRVFNSLSIGTPVISLRRPELSVDSAYELSTHWFNDANLEDYFGHHFGTLDWIRESQSKLSTWRSQHAGESISDLLNQLGDLNAKLPAPRPDHRSERPIYLNLAGERHFRPGWLNLPSASDLSCIQRSVSDQSLQTCSIPSARSDDIQPVHNSERVDEVYIAYEMDSRMSLQQLIRDCSNLLKEGGHITIDYQIGVHASDAPELMHAHQIALGTMRMALDDLLRSGERTTTLETCQVTALQEPTICGESKRNTLRFRMVNRKLTPRESVAVRCHGLSFGYFPEDLQGARKNDTHADSRIASFRH